MATSAPRDRQRSTGQRACELFDLPHTPEDRGRVLTRLHGYLDGREPEYALLVVINGDAELIAHELARFHRAQRDLDEIRASARSAASLTRQHLAFGRRQNLQQQMLDLNQVLRWMQMLLGRTLGEDLILEMELSASGRVTADLGQIEQVILNLAVNARDAMPNGGHLIIETEDADLDAACVAQHRGASDGRQRRSKTRSVSATEPTEIRKFARSGFITS